MKKELVYCFDTEGYEDSTQYAYDGLYPFNSTLVPFLPKKEGFVSRTLDNGKTWQYVENHIGEQGYVNSEFFEIKEYGAYPEDWSKNPPEPTQEEKSVRIRNHRDYLLDSTQWLMQRHMEELSASQNTSLSPEEYQAYLVYRQALRDFPSLAGFPWDGDIEKAPWPEKP